MKSSCSGVPPPETPETASAAPLRYASSSCSGGTPPETPETASAAPLRYASSSTPASLVAVLALVAACAEAGGEVKGGELTDGGVLATNPPPFAPDTGAADPGPDCLEMGTTWTALYTGLFGPTDRPGSCTFRSNCHGSPDEAGATAGAGVQCFDQKGCRQSFFDKGLVTPGDFAAPEKSILLSGLLRVRKPDGTTIGFMPQTPADYVFSDACVERIETWIKDGAKDD